MTEKQPTYNDVIKYQSILECSNECLKGVTWKASVQMFGIEILVRTGRIANDLKTWKFRSKGFVCFTVCERGKNRKIQAVHITERVVQKSLCRNALLPIIEPLLISTNTASRKGMGTSRAINDVVRHLESHYMRYGKSGGILVMDLHDYFNSINQDILVEMYKEVIEDESILKLSEYFIRCFDHGMGLGSEISQVSAIFYPNKIDHYVVDELKLSYARFMDDSYAICDDLNRLYDLKDVMARKYAEIGIEMNLKKTQVIQFAKGNFVYLKKRFCFAEDGKVVIRPVRKVFSDWRKLLKKHCRKYRNGEMTIYAVRQSYNCRYGMYSHFDCKKSLHEMDKLYMRLFDEMPNGQTIDDIRMRKNLYHYKDMYLRGEISLKDIGIKYTDWKETAEWYEEKKRVVKDMNKLVYKLFHITWNKLGGKNEGCNIIGCKRYQKIAC